MFKNLLLHNLFMIKPMFKFISKYEIKILDENTMQEIGCIETPAATIPEKESAIQVCGFDYACQLWGCGVYGYIKDDSEYVAKKDIQLLWTKPSVNISKFDAKFKNIREEGFDNCIKCYSIPCKCEEIKLYDSGEPMLDKL